MATQLNQADYVSVIYNEKDRPFTPYPGLLTRYLFDRYKMLKGQTVLDLGCGRGEFLKGFITCGLKGFGIDGSTAARALCPEAEIQQSDLEKEVLPYQDNRFDIIFSKSLLEHFYYPEKLIKEIYRILAPGGLVIALVPDWESVYRTFYEDYTHRTPFTVASLRDIHLIHGFENVKAEKFRQLPFVWHKPWLNGLCRLVAVLTPGSLKRHSKLVRFSKEVMLLASARKPVAGTK